MYVVEEKGTYDDEGAVEEDHEGNVEVNVTEAAEAEPKELEVGTLVTVAPCGKENDRGWRVD